MKQGQYMNTVNGSVYTLEGVVECNGNPVVEYSSALGTRYTLGLDEFNRRFRHVNDANIQLKLGQYRHIKTGNIYIAEAVIPNASNYANNALMVLYRNSEGVKYVREVLEFSHKFEYIK